MTDDKATSPAFCDPKNITYGRARVIWAKAVPPLAHEGWVLPGETRTANFAEAHACAVRMDALMAEMGA